ncbi:MAG: tyrosine-type recombinase/integrase [Faecalispora jeddahensis]
MNEHKSISEHIQAYANHLRLEEKSAATVEKYLRDIRSFICWPDGREITKERTAEWKAHLTEQGYAPASVNAMLSALNGLLDFLELGTCRVKFLKLQRRMFRDDGRDLTRSDYDALTAAAKARGKVRLALLMEAICATGIRVSEVRYITVEAAKAGRAEIALKGKIRTILLPNKLLKYAKQQKNASGEIFLTRNGTPLSRRQIWAEMKGLCGAAGVTASKVFPHNFRHLFATAFYRATRDIVKLADVLGHSSIETTRIYLLTSGAEHQRQLDRLGLVS